jgi:hypothetical protein
MDEEALDDALTKDISRDGQILAWALLTSMQRGGRDSYMEAQKGIREYIFQQQWASSTVAIVLLNIAYDIISGPAGYSRESYRDAWTLIGRVTELVRGKQHE